MFPQQEAKEGTSEEFRGDEAPIVAIGQRREMDMAIDQGFLNRIS